MKVIVANKDDYIKFNARLKDNMQTFELAKDTTDYIIHRVKLGKDSQDVSLMDSCINNLLDEQYEKRKYIELEEIQAINNLICNLSKAECQILNAYAEVKRYSIRDLEEIKELITNINDYQIVEAYNLHEVGKLIAEKVSGYKMDINVIPFMNFAKLAEDYLFDSKINEDFCSYGLLVNTRKMLDNELIQPKIEENKVFKIEVVNKKEFDESGIYNSIIIYLPTTTEDLIEKFQRINLDYDKVMSQDTDIIECEIVNFYNEELSMDFNKMIKRIIESVGIDEETTPFEEINLLCNKVKKFDNIKMSKFLAMVEIKKNKISSIHDLVKCAKTIQKYELLPDVKNVREMGKYLVYETGHFDDVRFLEDYIDYNKLVKDYTQKGSQYRGEFTEYGYLMKKEFLEKESQIENENEEEFE